MLQLCFRVLQFVDNGFFVKGKCSRRLLNWLTSQPFRSHLYADVLFCSKLDDSPDPLQKSTCNVFACSSASAVSIKAENRLNNPCLQWDVLLLLHHPNALQVIDGLFVENYYRDPLMAKCGWNQFHPRTMEDTALSLKELRNAGKRTHGL